MNLDLGNMKKIETNKEEKFIDGWSSCICPDLNCDLYFFQKSTLLEILNPYFEKWKDLPLDIKIRSLKSKSTGFMTVFLNIQQIGKIRKKQLLEDKDAVTL